MEEFGFERGPGGRVNWGIPSSPAHSSLYANQVQNSSASRSGHGMSGNNGDGANSATHGRVGGSVSARNRERMAGAPMEDARHAVEQSVAEAAAVAAAHMRTATGHVPQSTPWIAVGSSKYGYKRSE